jgi:uncharacterized membrane protein YvbJ
MTQIKCLNCSQVIDSTENFCPHCGHPAGDKTTNKSNFCPECGHENPLEVAFCEQCGTSLKTGKPVPETRPEKSGSKVLHSTGSYSGTMVQGKTSKSKKIFKYIFIVLILVGIAALIVWYNSDPNAKETLGNIIFSGLFILFFGIFIWFKNRKSGRRKKSNFYRDDDGQETYVNSDDDFDDDSGDCDD